MGTPDMLGTYGTFSFYTSASRPRDAFGRTTVDGGTITRVHVVDDAVQATLEGPDNPFRARDAKL